MRKLFAAALCMGFFATACIVTDDTCECFDGDPSTCLNAVDLGDTCDGCYWYVVDCQELCWNQGADDGYCEIGALYDECMCEYYK